MLASGMTADVSNISGTPIEFRQDVSTTSEASIESSDTATTTTKSITKPVNPNKGVESKVREYFSDAPIMAEISKCESRYRQFAPNGSIFRGKVNSQDVGVMQVNEFYHAKRAKKLGYNLRTLGGNLEYARLLYTEEGTAPWSYSAPCWMKSDVAKAMFAPKKLAEK